MTNEAVALLHAARSPKRHVHRWLNTDYPDGIDKSFCVDCSLPRPDYEARQARGRKARRAGHDAERLIAKTYGGVRTGMYGGPDDVLVGDRFSVQSKVRANFPSWMADELAKLPRTGGRIPTLIVSERLRPGAKHARKLVIRLLEDDLSLHRLSVETDAEG